MSQRVYFFGDARAEGDASMRNLLGGKGANLAEMVNLGLPVPPGFTINTEVCAEFNAGGNGRLPDGLMDEVRQTMKKVEASLGKSFGDDSNPLLLSVRSGARVSMPGMMDTVLNLGLNDDTVAALSQATDNPRFANDSYRRFLQMYGNVVLGVDGHLFETALDALKEEKGVEQDPDLSAADLGELIRSYKTIVREAKGQEFPQDPWDQLAGAVAAVFSSWNTDRAHAYRSMHDIPGDWGTAVNVQAMVFGNMGDDCATGVAFTRDPSTGERVFYGEYLVNAQGEDVVAGVRTPRRVRRADGAQSLEEVMPAAYEELVGIVQTLDLL